MLKSLHDLATGFKSLTTGGADVKSNPETSPEDGRAKHLGAGADLLNNFQTQWAKLHQEAEGNANSAEEVDQQVTSLYLRLEHQNNAMTQLVAELTCLPQLLRDIQQSMDRIGEIEVHCSELDTAVEELRDVCRDCDLHKNKQHHLHQLTLYQQRRQLELEQVKAELARKHTQTVESYEAKLRAILHEKQQACEDASKQEIEHYRLHGHTQLKPSTSADSQVELADICLDQDCEALDTFLQTGSGAGEDDMSRVTDVQGDVIQQDMDGPSDNTSQVDTGDRRQSDTGDRRQSDTDDRRQSDTDDRRQSDTGDRRQSDTVELDQSATVDTGKSDTDDMVETKTVKENDAPTTP